MKKGKDAVGLEQHVVSLCSKILYPSQFACHACLACQSYALQEGVTSLGKAAKQQNDNVIASTKKRQKTILANNNPSNQQQQQAQKQLQTR